MYHQAFYPQAQGFSNQHGPNQANFMPSHSYYYPPGPIPTHSSHNLNFTRDFDRHPTANPAFTSMPSGAHPFYDATNQHFDQQRWRPYTAKGHQQQRFHQMPAFHFQDKSTFYYMSDPMYTADDRITIQLTKVHIGSNGDQQRLFVEQEFSNERELGKFVRNLRFNFEKTFNNRATGTHGSTDNIGENAEFNGKKSGVFVVEEPDEEPKVYPQQDNPKSTPSPLRESIQFDKQGQNARSSMVSSTSTVRAHRRRKNKDKYRRQHKDAPPQPASDREQFNQKSRIFHAPSYSRYYEPAPPSQPTIPPRFQKRFHMKENDFRVRTDFSMPPNMSQHWWYNQDAAGYPFNNRSRAFMPSMNENIAPGQSRFRASRDPFFYPSPSTQFPRSKDQASSSNQPRRSAAQRRNQTTNARHSTVAENLVFSNMQEQRARVDRTRSECRQQIPPRHQNKTHDYLDYGPKVAFPPKQPPARPLLNRPFVPMPPKSSRPMTPIFYPPRHLSRNKQMQIRLFPSSRF